MIELKWHLIHLLLQSEADRPEGVALLDELKQAHPDLPAVKFLDAFQLAREGDWRRACEVLETAIPKLQGPPQLVMQMNSLLGECYNQLGDVTRRLQTYQSVLEQNRSNRMARWQYAEALVADGQLARAVDEYRQVASDGGAASLTRFAYVLLQLSLQSEPAHAGGIWTKWPQCSIGRKSMIRTT